MALQPLDLVVALTAAHIDASRGAWRPAEVQRALEIPWSTLDRSLDRLGAAAILREAHVSRIALASLLPALRYLFPLEIDTSRTVCGVPTSYASAAFEGHIRYQVAQVWPDAGGTMLGHPVKPLHPGLPAVAVRDPELGAVFALIDAVRGGRVREVSFAKEKLHALLGLPAPYAAA